MLHHLIIEYGDDVLFSTGLTRNEFDDEARFSFRTFARKMPRPS